jgi:hypothetical protein
MALVQIAVLVEKIINIGFRVFLLSLETLLFSIRYRALSFGIPAHSVYSSSLAVTDTCTVLLQQLLLHRG